MTCNNYIRDLCSRQNRDITTAQVHLFITAKRYTNKDLKEFIKMIKEEKDKTLIQKSLNDEKVNDGKLRQFRRKEGVEVDVIYKNEINPELVKEIEEKIEERILRNYFVYDHRLVMLDGEANLILKYKEDLLNELVLEFTKMYNWLDVRAADLRFENVEGKNTIITKEEVEMTILFITKLIKMKSDKQKNDKQEN